MKSIPYGITGEVYRLMGEIQWFQLNILYFSSKAGLPIPRKYSML